MIFSSQAHSDETFTGRWYVSITGQPFTLDITQRENEIQGIMIPQNSNKKDVSVISGTVDGKIVDILSSNRDLSVVYHFYGGIVGRGDNQAMVGHFTRNNRHYNRWHAIRYERLNYFGSPDMNYSVFHSYDYCTISKVKPCFQ